MAKKISRFGFAPQDQRISVLPSAIAGIFTIVLIVFNGITAWQLRFVTPVFLLGSGLFGIIYLVVFNFLMIPSLNYPRALGWINAVAATLGLGVLTYVLPEQADIYLGVLLLTFVITCTLIAGRLPSYVLILLTLFFMVDRNYLAINTDDIPLHLVLAIIAIIMVETILQLKNSSYKHINRLESVSNFSRAVASTLEANQVMALLNAAFQNSVEADTYFVGIRDGDEMQLQLLYDDGEFYENQRVKLEGSLSGWVMNNQQSLFLPDLRREVDLPGVRLVLAGRHKTSLSWMGVPMRSQNVDGIIAISSYHPNAFERADLELLTVLAQHAAQAIDNAYQHAQVEQQSRLDSLTNIYNHGYFLELLEKQIEQVKMEHKPLSVIMLDIDYFKQYNDTYGHLSGDLILRNLCDIIKAHLKRTDAVGRWGGEEFVISLPNADGRQAQHIAERIRSSMMKLNVHNHDEATIPVPTLSQGIALYPTEADEVIKLIDLADKRLYIAKERGRNQVEPSESHWEKIPSDANSQ